MQYLFVITYGRSGSTVLLNLLNAIEGYTIRGENCGIVSHLAKTVSLLRHEQAQPHAKAHAPHAPWYGIMDPDVDQWGQRLARAFAAEFLRPEADTRVLGFKEIRYSADELSDADYAATIDFLATYFPDSRFIFNTRAWAQVAESGWWRYYPNVRAVSELVRSADQRFHRSVEALGARAFLIDHAEYAGRPEGFRPMLDWLGEEMSEAVLAQITAQKLKHLQQGRDDRGTVLRLRRKLSMAMARASLRVPGRRASGSGSGPA